MRQLDKNRGEYYKQKLQAFENEFSKLTLEEFAFGNNYPYSKLVHHVLDLVTDEEKKLLEKQMLENFVLREKLKEVKITMEQNNLHDLQDFSKFMKSHYSIEID